MDPTEFFGVFPKELIDINVKEQQDQDKLIRGYEATLQAAISLNDKSNRKIKALEKDNLCAENAFSELRKKNEEYKSMLVNAKKNQDILERRDKEMTFKVTCAQAKVENMKGMLAKVVNNSKEWENRFKEAEKETAKLRAQLQKTEGKAQELAKGLLQKTREVERISKYCDELIDLKINH